jgi:hypothetical protein
MRAVACTEARIKHVAVEGGMGERHGYIGEPGQLDDAAQAFLVVRPFAGARIEPHFHDVDQFQVIVQGDGRIGKKAVRPVTFQYADAYTPYGPIVANDHGLSFFTLRNIASGGFWAMPGHRHVMPGRAGRNIEGVFELSRDLPAAGESVRETLMTPQPDGVLAAGFRLGAGAACTGLDIDGKGQFYLVCTGAIIVDGKVLAKNSVVRIEPDDSALALQATDEGAQVLGLQFAGPSDRPGTDPGKLAERASKGYVNLRASTS